MKIKIVWLLLCLPFVLSAATIPVQLEHAITEAQKEYGLMGRTELAENEGMLFHYNPPKRISIWMYNTKMDLSLAFLDANGFIREIHEMKSFPDVKDQAFFAKRLVTSSFAAAYALEMRSRWFEDHDVKVGDRLILMKRSPEAYIKTAR